MSGTPPLRLAQESIAGARPYQEDAVLAEPLSDGRTLVAVADGMGGHAAGDVASALALETLKAALLEGRDLEAAFLLANERVLAEANEPGKEGMGTTLVAMLLTGGSYQIANIGDSRGYVLATGGIQQVTEDHSYVAEAIRQGQSESEAAASKWRNVLTRAIGTDAELTVDLFGPFPVEDGTAVLLCSDGLYKALSDGDLQDLFVQSAEPPGAAQAMIAEAYEQGSDDNISVAIAEFGEVPRDRSEATVQLKWTPPDEYLGSDADSDDSVAESLGGAAAEASEAASAGASEEDSVETSEEDSVEASEEDPVETSEEDPAQADEDDSEHVAMDPEEQGVSASERDDSGGTSTEVAPPAGPPMGVIGAVVVVLLVIAYLIFGR